MSSADDKVRALIAEEAAEWFVANREDLGSKERQAFAAWLRTSPIHVEEYLAHSVIARDLHQACEYSEPALAGLLDRARASPDLLPSPSRRIVESRWTHAPRWGRIAGISAACAVAATIAWVVLHEERSIEPAAPPEAVEELHLSTLHGEQQSRRLADNSIVHLNTDSDVTIRYSVRERLVVLHSGEADFNVVHQPGRPFRVLAGAAQIIDVGTQFDVQLGRDTTVVTVVEGQVALSSSKLPGQRQTLVDANQQVTVVGNTWPPARAVPIDSKQTTAWLHRQIVFNHEPLDKVAAEFNRYAPKPIEIVTPGLQKLEISGVFTTDDPGGFIAFLRSLGNVRVEETATQIRVSGHPR